MLTQPDTNGRKGRRITKILEFDLIIKTTKLVKGQGLAKLLAESNCKFLGINFVFEISIEKNPQETSQSLTDKNPQEPSRTAVEKNPQEPSFSIESTPINIDEKILLSEWYTHIVYFLRNFECPSEFTKNQCKTLKLKAIKYCIINENLYWKDPLNILLLFLIESETKGIIDQFHVGIFGGNYA